MFYFHMSLYLNFSEFSWEDCFFLHVEEGNGRDKQTQLIDLFLFYFRSLLFSSSTNG